MRLPVHVALENAMRTCTDTMQTANDTPRIPVHAALNTVVYWNEVFLHSFDIKKYNDEYVL